MGAGYYQEYLSNLCTRRQWPEPTFAMGSSRDGYYCTARVNNREYMTDGTFESAKLAREDAAMQAYWRCQNFSRNDGKHPKDSGRGHKSQGRPIAIGTERASTYSDDSRSSGSRSGGSSPTGLTSFASYGAGYHMKASGSGGSSSSGSSSRNSSSSSSSRKGGSSRYRSHGSRYY